MMKSETSTTAAKVMGATQCALPDLSQHMSVCIYHIHFTSWHRPEAQAEVLCWRCCAALPLNSAQSQATCVWVIDKFLNFAVLTLSCMLLLASA
jgi:hypothetical protein